MSLRVWWGRLKWIGTDSSVLFCIPRLCSPKRSLRVRPVCPMYCEGRVVSVFKHRLQLIMQIKLSEEQERFRWIVLVCPVL